LPGSDVPGKVASQHGWKNIADVYDYLWGFLTWSYGFSLLTYCTMVLRELLGSALRDGDNGAGPQRLRAKKTGRTM